METSTPTSLSTSLYLLNANPHSLPSFNSLFTNLNHTLLLCEPHNPTTTNPNPTLKFASTSIYLAPKIENPQKPIIPNWLKPSTRGSPQVNGLLKNLSIFERTLIGAGGIAGAFTYVCLHPLDTIKTKLQTKGVSQVYENTIDVVAKTFQENGILGFYSGISVVIVVSAVSSAVYFGTCEFGKSILQKMNLDGRKKKTNFITYVFDWRVIGSFYMPQTLVFFIQS